MEDLVKKKRTYVSSRKIAYQQTFNMESQAVKAVLADLAKFCRGTKSTFHPDPRLHAELEGRREVFLRITEHLNLSVDELMKLYGGVS